jgi:hypothetical protein
MKILSILFSFGAVVMFTTVPLTANRTHEPQERTIRRIDIERNEPIAVTGTRVNGRVVLFGERFVAEDDWMKGLVISVKNTSDKLILFVSLGLRFPRPANSQDKISVTDVSTGNRALLTRPPTGNERLVGIAPGETVDLRLSADEFDGIQRFLAGTGYPSSIEKLDLAIDSVIFEDDAMWSNGARLLRDPKDSSKWINTELMGIK